MMLKLWRGYLALALVIVGGTTMCIFPLAPVSGMAQMQPSLPTQRKGWYELQTRARVRTEA